MKRTGLMISMLFLVVAGSVSASEAIARVNGKTIDKKEANIFIKSTQPILDYGMISPEDRRDVINRLIERELLLEAAKKSDIEKSDFFREELRRAKEEIMIKALLQKSFEETIVSASEAKEYYRNNPDKFKSPEKVHARHILLKEEKSAREIIDELKTLKGKELEKRFIELAKERSIAPSAQSGGDLGFFGRNQMLKEFEEKAFSMKAGELSLEPVHSQYGWHVIYVVEKKPAGTVDFDEIKSEILRELKKENFAKRMEKEIEAMKKSADIEILDTAVKSLGSDKNDSTGKKND